MQGEEKDRVALIELSLVIEQLTKLKEDGKANLGTCRPILASTDIDLIEDHLELVKKYIKL